MTQQYVSLRAQVTAIPTLVAADTYEMTAQIFDDSGLYNGTDVAIGQQLLVLRGSGNDMDVYTVASVSAGFSGSATFQVTDAAAQGNPGFGVFGIVEASPSGIFPEIAGASEALNQAITQYNLPILETLGGGANLYSADGQLAGARIVDQNGNTLDFQDGAQSVAIAAGTITTTNDIEVTGTGNGIIRTSPDGSRYLETTNNLGVTSSVKLP